jgi:hypothetical protein
VLNLGCDFELADRAGCAKSSKVCGIAGFGKVWRIKRCVVSSLIVDN